MRPFKLAALKAHDPARIVSAKGEDRLQSFLLTLALIYNDLKGLQLMHNELQAIKRPREELSSTAGQWSGLELQVHRYLMGMIREVLLFVADYQAEAQSAQVKNWLRSAHPSVRKRWASIVSIATGGRGTSDKTFTTTLIAIRSNAAFHYNQHKLLVRGYRKFFLETPPNRFNEHAYASIGRNMEETRFYYADAAMQVAVEGMADGAGGPVFVRRVVKLAHDLNHAIEYLLRRQLEAAQRPEP